MIELFEKDIRDVLGSSKGNQLKWSDGRYWYKSDYLGYEGLAEYAASLVLVSSDLPEEMYVSYSTERILYKDNEYNGCKSRNMISPEEQLITVERLVKQAKGESIGRALYAIPDHAERLRHLVDTVTALTGLKDFGRYMSIMLTVDGLLLNEDRHTHNIAVIRKEDGSYRLCPLFDFGAGLLSDTKADYSLSGDAYELIETVHSKTFCDDFREAIEIGEKLYGEQVHFTYDSRLLEDALKKEPFYSAVEKERVKTVLLEQKRKYPYLFNR